MSYQILWNKRALDSLDVFEKGLSERIVAKVMSLKDNPYYFIERLAGNIYFKLRVGDYRAIIEIDDARKIIFVRLVGHRSGIYKMLNRLM